ncbi:MAG: PIN domain nuclease of toxin-antitoxin system [Myxococcota bacterium]|jgi:PIN domain nuclease of toxin-antitoxin system
MECRDVIVLDTHAWIWYVADPDRLSEPARLAIAGASSIAVSPISCWEIATKAARGKLILDRDVDVWIRQALACDRVELTPISASIATQAGLLGNSGFHGDPADRILAATAMAAGTCLVTKDAQIQAFEPVQTVW